MNRSPKRDRDIPLGQAMVTLRTAMGLTQTEVADFLSVSRRTVGAWEADSKYPRTEHLQKFIELCVEHRSFESGHEAEEIRIFWRTAHQKVLLDEAWLAALFTPVRQPEKNPPPVVRIAPVPTSSSQRVQVERKALINLPIQLTSFFGRRAELTEIARILSDSGCRLLTLLGPGGVGKTRLAIEVVSAQAGLFPDGVAFVALAPIGTPNRIVSAIGDALNVSFAGQADPAGHMLSYLRQRRLLLILDNFEHLLAGADLVHDILQHAPDITILVTSRERLNLRGEWLFDVDGLSYPPQNQYGSIRQSLTDLAEYSAVQLFAQRAMQVQVEFSPSESTLTAIVGICQHVSGMPLAIELAADSVRMMPIAEIDRQIRSNLDMLATTMRDIPMRHRSMRAVFDHSWNLMNELERSLLTRLSVFRGGCTVEAAEQVTGAMLRDLLRLVDKSLLRQINPTTRTNAAAPMTAVDPRFFLLEPIREYALEKLRLRGEFEMLQQTHAAYYLSVAEAAASLWDTPAVDSSIEQINHEHDNMRAALKWALDGGFATIGLQLAGALWRYWRGGGAINEGRAWLADMLELDDAAADNIVLAARLRALHGAAWLASDQHDFAHAARLFEQSKVLRQALKQQEGETDLLLNAGRQVRASGEYRKATTLLEEALTLHRELGNRGSSGSAGLGLSLYELALVLRETGELDRAAMLYQECMDFHREIGDREGMTSSLLGLGDVARDQGDIEGMRKYTEESLILFRDLGIQWAIGFCLNNLAQAAYLEGDLTSANDLVSESVSLFRNLKDDSGLAEVLITNGHILRAQGDMVTAYKVFTEALQLARAVGPRVLVAAALEGLAVLATQSQRAAQSVPMLAAASTLRTQLGMPIRPVDKAMVEQATTAALSILSADIFSALWESVRKMPLEATLDSISSSA